MIKISFNKKLYFNITKYHNFEWFHIDFLNKLNNMLDFNKLFNLLKAKNMFQINNSNSN